MVLCNVIPRRIEASSPHLWSSSIISRQIASVCGAVVKQYPKPDWALQSNSFNIISKEKAFDEKTHPYVLLLQTCTNIRTLGQIHARMLISGLEQDVFLGTKLVHLYSKYGSLANARLVFDKINKRNAFLWNAIIRGYAWNGPYEETLVLYSQMQRTGIWPDNFTYSFALKACSGLSDLREGRKIHYHIVRSGFDSHVHVGTALIDMYAKGSSIEDARQVFDKMLERDVVAWNAMIAGYAQNGHFNEALILFHRMRAEDVMPDSVTMVNVLPVCAYLGNLDRGKCIHDYILRNGFDSDLFVGNSLIDMYAKCGGIETARRLFDRMSERDVVSWNAMIAGYAQNGHASEALTIFHEMLQKNVMPNSIAISSVISACAHLGALEQGKWIHDYISKGNFELDVFVTNALIDMYAKCGNLEVAHKLFDTMSERDVVSWNAMIAGYGLHGNGKGALELFFKMRDRGMKPNDITFIHVLSACSHAGLVDEGCRCFDYMTQDYCIKPNTEHYSCMVDLLGRAGHLEQAINFIKSLPVEPDSGVWGALLGACRIHGNVELGECVAERLFNIGPTYPGYYVLLSNMYAEAGRWEDVIRVRRLMKDRGLKKTPGWSTAELHGRVHTFYAGDKSHPQSEEIYATLESLARQIEKAGYVPNTNFVLHDVEQEEKEDMLCSHSEKLAIAFALINTSPGTPIRITKNLRVCGDCHCATKFISKIVRREIIVRDAHRFHHFKDGWCSCRDYW